MLVNITRVRAVSIPQAVGTIAMKMHYSLAKLLSTVSIPQAVGTIAMRFMGCAVRGTFDEFQYRKR